MIIKSMEQVNNMEKYLSGWEALNIPNEKNMIADWHPLHFFGTNQEIKMYSHNPILKEEGISKRFIPMLQREEYVANYPRAIADLVYVKQTQGLKNCCYDFLDQDEEKELYEMLKKLLPVNPEIENFLKYELTKLYCGEFNA